MRVGELPDDASLADIRREIEHVEICDAVALGQAAVEEGRVKTQAETAKLYREWIGK